MDVKLSSTRQLSPVFESGGRLDLDVLRPVLEQHAASMVEDARDGWPVDTGISRDAWQAEIDVSPTELFVSLINEARQRGRGYAVYIHRARSRRLVYTEVQERLTLNLIPALQADIAVTLAESMRG
jgi:hypothetical protein